MYLDEDVVIDVGQVRLAGRLVLPSASSGVVAFAHGSGSSRHSPRNQHVAETLHRAGLGTVLADLLTPAEEEREAVSGELRFDISLLATRVTGILDWLADQPTTSDNQVGLFGASTGAAAALVAAYERPSAVRAVVSRCGRPELAGDALDRVSTPTLLVVGGNDAAVLPLNREALQRLPDASRLEVVLGATHLFEEPGALDQMADLASEWFVRHLANGEGAGGGPTLRTGANER